MGYSEKCRVCFTTTCIGFSGIILIKTTKCSDYDLLKRFIELFQLTCSVQAETASGRCRQKLKGPKTNLLEHGKLQQG